jgi:CO/xanthine dehydrogenase FAD-binding subunit
VKPPQFEYHAPRVRAEVLELLARYGSEAKLLAGGQSLVPLLNFRLARPSVLVDLNTVADLDTLQVDSERRELVFGPLVRQTQAERSALVGEQLPLVRHALGFVGHRAIRNRGTVCGSLAHADPAAELPLVLIALGGRLRLVRASGERWVAANDFFVSYLSTALEPDELLLEARFAIAAEAHVAWGFNEVSRRRGDFALAAAAVLFRRDATGVISEATIAVAGAGPTPVVASRAGAALLGEHPTDTAIAEAASLAAQLPDVDADLHASAEYRRTLISVVVERALVSARSQVVHPAT